MFFIIEKSEEATFNFSQNLLNYSSNKESKFATKRWYAINSQTAKDKYNQNNSIIL